ncbi:MAG: diguanylate cyclase [Phycisphaerae bacterium]|nr:diguanylate cyclase [Phycisphaerae bacterium]
MIISKDITDEASPARPRGPRVLIVEDDPDQCELICESVQMHFEDRRGTEIVGVGTGTECMDQQLCDFDIILLDYNLPDICGFDLLEQITGKYDIPVIFVTGNNDIASAAEAIRRGAQDYIVKLGDYLFALPIAIEKNIRLHTLKQENAHLQAELTSTLQEVQVKNIELEQSLQKLRTMASTDHLTGLSNRRTFAEILQRCYNEAVRYKLDLTCLMCDLDYFKAINDTLGHQVGDQVLVASAEIIRSNLRSSDHAARYGGDEFVILLPHTSLAKAMKVGNRICQQIVPATGRRTRTGTGITLSIGFSSLEIDQPASADVMVSMADRALYVAKDRGKNCIVAFSEIGATSQHAAGQPAA